MRIYRSEALIKGNASIHIFSSKEDSVSVHSAFARAVGFSCKSSFYRVFQRITGMTFSQYKKKYQSKE